MHLADGIVSPAPLVISLDLLGACGVSWALGSAFAGQRRQLAYTGTLAAFVLALQAVNVPLVPGASAHVIGAGLLTLALGPARAIVAMSAVLLVQALLLGDGGLTVLGLNIVNLAIIPTLAVQLLQRLFGASTRGLALTAALGTLLGAVLSAACLALVLTTAAGAPLGFTFAWLIGVQALAGLGEGLLTALAAVRLKRTAPGLLAWGPAQPLAGPTRLDEPEPSARPRLRRLRLALLAVAIVAAVIPLASGLPDALEVVLLHLPGRP